MALNFNNVMLGTDNVEQMKDFYNKVFGKPMWEDGGFTGWLVGNGSIMLGEHSEVHGKAKEPQRIIMFLESKDVEGEFKRIKDLGAEVVAEPYHPGDSEGFLATFADPDGNYINLASPYDEMMPEK